MNDCFLQQILRQNAKLLFFLIPSAAFGRTDKSFSSYVPSVILVDVCDQDPSLDTPASYCAYVLKHRVCEHDMSCALEISSNEASKRGHVESCPSTTTNIISPLPQCLWPPNLAGW